MPKRLPLQQLLNKMIHDMRTVAILCLRWSLVSFVWLGWLPYCTRHIWRSSIRVGDSLTTKYTLSSPLLAISSANLSSSANNITTVANATATLNSQDTIETFLPFTFRGLTSSEHFNRLLVEIMEGQVITSIIIVIFVVVFLIREWIIQNNANLLAETPQFVINGVPEVELRGQHRNADAQAVDDVIEPAVAAAADRRVPNVDRAEPRTLIPLQPPSSDASDWDNLRVQAARVRAEHQTEDQSQDSINAIEASLNGAEGIAAADNETLTAAELRALRRQAVLRATTQRLQQPVHRAELGSLLQEASTALGASKVPNSGHGPSATHLDQVLAEQYGEPSADQARRRAARQRSAERKMWEQAETMSGEQYPDSPMPLPSDPMDEVEGLHLSPPRDSHSVIASTSLTQYPDTDPNTITHNDSQISNNGDSQSPVMQSANAAEHSIPATTSTTSISLTQEHLDILLEQIRAAQNPAERTHIANAAIQVCIDLAQLLRPGVPLDRASPIYRETIRQVGMIAMVANEYGISHALDVEGAFRLAEERPIVRNDAGVDSVPLLETAAIANQVAGVDQNVMRELQAAVVDAEAENNAARDDMDDDIEGLLELIGVRGPIVALLQNSMLVVVMISGFIFFGVCMPYIVGKLVLSIVRDPTLYFIDIPVSISTLIMRETLKLGEIAYRGAEILSTPILMHSRTVKYSIVLLRKINNLIFDTVFTPVGVNTSIIWRMSASIQHIIYSHGEAVTSSSSYGKVLVATRSTQLAISDKIVSILCGYTVLTTCGSLYLRANQRITSGEQGKQIELFVRAFLRQTGFVMKFIAILGIELVVFPFYCGVLLDIVLLQLFGGITFAGRLSFFSKFPFTAMFLHWLVGTIYMFNFALFVSMCREIVRPGVLFFIRDPNDPAFNPIKDILERSVRSQMRKIGISVLIYGGLILGAFGSVVWTVCHCIGNILPLSWGSSEPLFEVPFDLLLFQILLPLTYRYVKPHKKIKAVWTTWFTAVSRTLRLSSFIMGERDPLQEGHFEAKYRIWSQFMAPPLNPAASTFIKDGSFRRAPNTDSLPMRKDKNMIMSVTEDNVLVDPIELPDDTADDPNYTVVYAPPNFRVRIYLFMIAMWMFAAVFGVSSTIVPLIFGRKIFRAISPKQTVHDLFAYLYGVYAFGLVLWMMSMLSRFRTNIQRSLSQLQWIIKQPKEALLNLKAGLVLAAKWAYLLSTMSILIPALLGLCLETYVIIPLGIWYNPAYVPTVHLVHDWIVGLIYVKIFGRTAVMIPTSSIGQALNRTIRNDWRRGWKDPDLAVATKELIIPISTSLIAALAIPLSVGALARQTVYRTATQDVGVLIYRMSYPAALVSCSLLLALKGTYILAQQWRAKIRDSLYLKGKQLHNFGDPRPPLTTPSSALTNTPATTGPSELDQDLGAIEREAEAALHDILQAVEDEEVH